MQMIRSHVGRLEQTKLLAWQKRNKADRDTCVRTAIDSRIKSRLNRKNQTNRWVGLMDHCPPIKKKLHPDFSIVIIHRAVIARFQQTGHLWKTTLYLIGFLPVWIAILILTNALGGHSCKWDLCKSCSLSSCLVTSAGSVEVHFCVWGAVV